jgi:ribosomal protein S18 acetylase RimI-like enzyme
MTGSHVIREMYSIDALRAPSKRDLDSIARLYRESIPQSFLARLRPGFFERLMESALKRSLVGVFVLRERLSGETAGFLVHSRAHGWMKKAVSARPAVFAVELLKNLFNPDAWSYAFGALHAKSRGSDEEKGGKSPAAEMFAIAVAGQLRDAGWGKKLVEAFEKRLAEEGGDGYIIMTLADNAVGNAFYKKMGALLCGTHESPNGAVNVYCKKLSGHA